MYKGDLHIHTVLSACADLEMTPKNIIDEAKKKGLSIIGITDHNSTYHAKLTRDIGAKNGIYVLMGVEVTTKEDVHCLAFFETDEQLDKFQIFISNHLPKIKNRPEIFGYQPVLDINENIVRMEEYLLNVALTANINSIEKRVHDLNGIFIPAHIDKLRNGLISHLGFVPENLKYDALEITRHTTAKNFKIKNPELNNKTIIQNSDAHFLTDIGCIFNNFSVTFPDFGSLKALIMKKNY